MTEQKTEKSYQIKDKHIKRGALGLGGAGLLLAGALAGNAFLFKDNRVSADTNPTPSATELATPRPSEAGASPSEAPVKIETFHFDAGGKFQAQSGDVVIGDVAMSDTDTTESSKIKFLYDTDTNKQEGKDNTKTGMLVDVQKEGVVLFPYGGDVIRGLQGEKKSTWMNLKIAEMENGGCVGGCTDGVTIVEWTGFDSTMDQAKTMTEGKGGVVDSPSSSFTPEFPANWDSMTSEEKLLWEIDQIRKELADCGVCAKPEPTCSPSASPKPSEAPCDTASDHLMKAGETYKVSGKRFIVQGDVYIDGKRYFDNSEKTGAIDLVLDGQTHTIKAPWGADVQVFCETASDATVNELYQKDLSQLKGSGRSLDSSSLD